MRDEPSEHTSGLLMSYALGGGVGGAIPRATTMHVDSSQTISPQHAAAGNSHWLESKNL